MSTFIQEIQHLGVKPVSVEREAEDMLVINGIRFTGDFFREFAEEQELRGTKAPIIRTVRDVVLYFHSVEVVDA